MCGDRAPAKARAAPIAVAMPPVPMLVFWSIRNTTARSPAPGSLIEVTVVPATGRAFSAIVTPSAFGD